MGGYLCHDTFFFFFLGFILQCGCEGPKVVTDILFTYMGKPHGENIKGQLLLALPTKARIL